MREAVERRATTDGPANRGPAGDLLIACVIAGVMTLGWAAMDWPMLRRLHLPDTDDVMRLQQVRDWLGGQAFADMAQHRLGAPPGLTMHWSRLADLAPAALIAVLTPLLGAYAAELAALILWPATLFAAAIWLVGAIARRIDADGQPRTAMIVAALAYPATTIFLPGRIDHHGLQVVLLLVAVRALVATPGAASGAIIGAASAAGLMIGLETAPLLAVIGACLWVRWCMGGDGRALTGYGLALGAALALGAWLLGGPAWLYPACDGFTATAWTVEMTGVGAAIAIGLSGRFLPRPAARATISIGLALVAGWSLHGAINACLHPYAGVDPLLASLWLGHVGEAQPLFAADVATAIGYAGLMAAGLAATGWRWWRNRHSGWGLLMAVQLGAVALTCLQLRGAYAGAMLAAPALAMAIAAARAKGAGWLAAAWVASAGMLYPIAAAALVHGGGAADGAPARLAGCTAPALIDALAALPAGTVMAPMDTGPYAIAGTRHRLVAAPYHRNNAGNLAMYRFYLGDPATARRIAAHWHVDYVVACAGGLGGVGPKLAGDPRRMAAMLAAGRAPTWLRPAATLPAGIVILAVDRRQMRQ